MSPPLEQRIERDSSFERLYRLHRRDVYGAVLRDVRDPAEAEDVTQIAFLNAFRAMRKGEHPDKPRAWLVTIARNVIRRRYRELMRFLRDEPDFACDYCDFTAGVDRGEAGIEIVTHVFSTSHKHNVRVKVVLPPDRLVCPTISDIYPTTEFRRERGSISGRVTKNGTGVFGAHVTAYHLETGQFVGGFTLSSDGTYTLGGLQPGPHVLRVEPLDDGDVESFFDGSEDVDLDFRVKFHERIVAVPPGGGVRNIDVRVVPK